MLRRSITAREFIAALSQDGFHLQRVKGSHRIFRTPDGRRVVVAYHGLGQTFPSGTLRAMVNEARWTSEDVARLGLGE